jgi:opacity protein-like surface antigen
MKRLTAALLLTFVAIAGAQAKPDLSGRWTTDPDPASAAQPARGAGPGGRGGPPPNVGSGWGSTITITQTATSFTVEYAFFTRGDMQPPLKFVYALDGSESKNTVMMGRGLQVQTSRTTWAGDSLVITSDYSFTDPQSGKPATAEVKRTLKLESPTSLSIETVYGGVMGGPATTTRTVYRKI